jgi:steroid 5-alpha reductase family enzyme
MTKKLKYGLALLFYWMCNFSYAMNKGKMPSEVKDNTDLMESVMVWAITIGGVVVIGVCFWAIHKNKGQGGWVEMVAWSLISLAAFGVLMTWWITYSNTKTSGFIF